LSDALDRRLEALARAVELAEGRLDEDNVAAARRVVERAGQRLGLGLDATLVALAGPTGAGKSSLFNALAGDDVSAVGRRRPTTASAAAVAWGDPSPALLEWLGVPRRHRAEDDGLAGLVLVDLPDFDSVERSHRAEADRVIELVDLLVWVVDPQKYADASLHEGYLLPLARHSEAMLVVLNQTDVLDPGGVARIEDDLRRLLRGEGLDGVGVIATSATTGDGLDVLRGQLADAVRRRAAALARLGADVGHAANALAGECAPRARAGIRKEDRERLRAALAVAAGVQTVRRAVQQAHRRRGTLAVGWPFVRWVRRFRPDPLRRLRLPERPAPEVKTSLPPASAVHREQVAAATRTLAAGAAGDLPPPWPGLLRSAATRREDEVADALDRAVAGADLHVSRPRWWSAAGLFQTGLAAVTLAGLAWLIALGVLAWLGLDEVVPDAEVNGVPLPTLLLLGGAAAGILLAFLFGLVNRVSASRRARAAARSLGKRVNDVAEVYVLGSVEEELDAHRRLCEHLARAAG
jgi:GTP-binding protein EngB required for normal cell division